MSADAVIGVLSDGKPGHVNQSLGLAQALVAQGSAAGFEVLPWPQADVPAPAGLCLLVGAGRRCLSPLLRLKRRWHVPAVALMRAGWRTPFLDAVIVPRHDRVLPWPNVLRSEGALNACRAQAQRGEQAAVLLGGPSRHVRWCDAQVLQQLRALLAAHPQLWIITSRRTPEALLETLRAELPAAQLYTPQDCAAQWLRQTLPELARVWVSSDSVSMVYEALSAGVPVTLIDIPFRSKRGKMQRSVQRLHALGFFDRDPVPPLQEAERCAAVLRARLAL